METKRSPLTQRQRFWLEHVRACERQGGTMKAYAARHDLDVAQFYSWKSRLKRLGHAPSARATCAAPAPGAPALSAPAPAPEPGAQAPRGAAAEFLALRVVGDAPSAWRIHLPNGICIECAPLGSSEWPALVQACLGGSP